MPTKGALMLKKILISSAITFAAGATLLVTGVDTAAVSNLTGLSFVVMMLTGVGHVGERKLTK